MIRCFAFEPQQAMKVRCHLLLVYILFFLQYKKGLKRLSSTLKLLGSHPLSWPPPSSSFPHSFFSVSGPHLYISSHPFVSLFLIFFYHLILLVISFPHPSSFVSAFCLLSLSCVSPFSFFSLSHSYTLNLSISSLSCIWKYNSFR